MLVVTCPISISPKHPRAKSGEQNKTGGRAVIIPWNELATLIRIKDRISGAETEREILHEGPLYSVIAKVAATPKEARRGFSVSLPDRRVRPHTFDEYGLESLIADPSRPRTAGARVR